MASRGWEVVRVEEGRRVGELRLREVVERLRQGTARVVREGRGVVVAEQPEMAGEGEEVRPCV